MTESKNPNLKGYEQETIRTCWVVDMRGSLAKETTPSTSTTDSLVSDLANATICAPAPAASTHCTELPRSRQHDKRHPAQGAEDLLREPADQHAAARGGGRGAEVADLGPRAAGHGLGLGVLDGDVAVVGREGVLGAGHRLLLLALRRPLGLPSALLQLLLARCGQGGEFKARCELLGCGGRGWWLCRHGGAAGRSDQASLLLHA